jgi:4'-phosphopantetheinyl transferase
VSLHYAAVPAEPSTALEDTWLPRLPPGKRARVRRLRESVDRNASLLGVALLAEALSALDFRFDPGALEYRGRTKPRLPGGPDFSITHAAGLVACAVSASGRVGLDLEPSGSVAAATVRRVLDSAERERLAAGEFTATDAWVMKEASVKLVGRGVGALGDVRLAAGSALLDEERFALARVELVQGYTAWLATDARATVEVRGIHADRSRPLPPGR